MFPLEDNIQNTWYFLVTALHTMFKYTELQVQSWESRKQLLLRILHFDENVYINI